MTERVVIVGAGLGGLRAAEGLRAERFAGEIVVIGEELHHPYSRPPLSKTMLSRSDDPSTIMFRKKPTVADVTWRLGHTVTKIDLDDRQLELDGVGQLAYSALVFATGARARRLDVPGPPPRAECGRHVLRTLDDALRLRAALRPGARLVVIGAGFIGCELAISAARLGCNVVCVTADPEPMLRPLGAHLGRELRRRHSAAGITFMVDVGIHAFLGDDYVTGVLLTDGSALAADVVVEAIGSECNTESLQENGLDLTDGVLVDQALRPIRAGLGNAPVDGVSVVGDVARFPQPLLAGAPQRIEHWAIPTETGRRAGRVLAEYLDPNASTDVAAESDWLPVPYFWSEQPPVRIHSFGLPGAGDPKATRVLEGRLDSDCVVGYFDAESQLIGVVGLGEPRALNPYRSALSQHVPSAQLA